MAFSPGDKVWVKRSNGHWWPALVAESPLSVEKARKRRRTRTISVKYPFEEDDDIVPEGRRIKSFDCAEFDQFSTGQENERSTRRRSSVNKELFQRALSVVMSTNNNNEEVESKDTSKATEQETSIPVSLGIPTATVSTSNSCSPFDSPVISDTSLKRALLSIDLPDITPSKRIRRPAQSLRRSAINDVTVNSLRCVRDDVIVNSSCSVRIDVMSDTSCSVRKDLVTNSPRSLRNDVISDNPSSVRDDVTIISPCSVRIDVMNDSPRSLRNDVITDSPRSLRNDVNSIDTSQTYPDSRRSSTSLQFASPEKRLCEKNQNDETATAPSTVRTRSAERSQISGRELLLKETPQSSRSDKNGRKIHPRKNSLVKDAVAGASDLGKNDDKTVKNSLVKDAVAGASELEKNDDKTVNNSLVEDTVTGASELGKNDDKINDMMTCSSTDIHSKENDEMSGRKSPDFTDDSDDDLPVFSSQSPAETQGSNFVPGDIVWAKCRNFPLWPAVLRNVYKKRGKLDKISVFFIGDAFKKEQKGFCFKYHPTKLKHFCCTEGGHPSEEGNEPAVKAVVGMVDDYLIKKALGKIQRSPFEHFQVTEPLLVMDEGINLSSTLDDLSRKRPDDVIERVTSSDTEDEESEDGSPDEQKRSIPDKVAGEMKRVATRTRKLVDFIGTEECKKFVRSIIRGSEKSELHDQFNADDESKLGNFGPIEDDDQMFEVYYILMKICEEEKFLTFTQRQSYVSTVLAPEAIVYAMRRCVRYSRPRAWALFRRGPTRHSSAVQQYEHESILASVERIPHSERMKYRRLQAGRWQRLREKFERS